MGLLTFILLGKGLAPSNSTVQGKKFRGDLEQNVLLHSTKDHCFILKGMGKGTLT